MSSSKFVYDFNCIRTSQESVKFEPKHAQERYLESRQWLKEELSQAEENKTVVVTHFPPALLLRHAEFEVDEITAYFQANCLDLLQQHKPKLWLYGHNHWSDDRKIGSTRCVSNQFGYPNEGNTNKRYKTSLIIKI